MTVSLRGSLGVVTRSTTSVTASSTTGVVGDIVLFAVNGLTGTVSTTTGLTTPTLLTTLATFWKFYIATVTATTWSQIFSGGGNYVSVSWGEFYVSYAATWALNLSGASSYTAGANTIPAPSLVDSHADSIYFSAFDSQDNKGGAGTSLATIATGFSSSDLTSSGYNQIAIVLGPITPTPDLQFGSSYLNTSANSNVYPAITVVASPPAAPSGPRVYSQAVQRASAWMKRESGLWSPESGLIPRAA